MSSILKIKQILLSDSDENEFEKNLMRLSENNEKFHTYASRNKAIDIEKEIVFLKEEIVKLKKKNK